MAEKLTDNEWAAGYLGLKLMNLRSKGVKWTTDMWYWCSGEQDTWKSDPESGPKSSKQDWKPDSDLNQFKLVLDKYMDEAVEPFVQALYRDAWSDPARVLEAIRAAVEAV